MTANTLPAYPKRTISICLPDDLLDAIDAAVVMTGAESRSALIRDFVELGLSLLHDPVEAVPLLLDGVIANLERKAESDEKSETAR